MDRLPINLRRVAIFIGILFFILVIMDFNDRLDDLNRLQKQDGVLQAQATQGMQTYTALEAQATYAASDQAVQEWARTEGDYAQPGDQIALPVGPITARLLNNPNRLLRQLPCRTGKSGGIYSLAINKSAPFLISDRLALFPDSTRIQNDSLTIAGHNLASLADQYGTPLYIYDRATMDSLRRRIQRRVESPLSRRVEYHVCGQSFSYAKPSHNGLRNHHLWLDCTGEGEIAIAVSGDVQPENILVHGVNKSISDLESAIRHAGTIVVDNLAELHTPQ